MQHPPPRQLACNPHPPKLTSPTLRSRRFRDLPSPPTPVDLSQLTDKEARKQAEKEAKRAQKTYETAIKNRDKAIKERQKLVEKWRRRLARDAEKRDKEAQKEAQKQAANRRKEEQKRQQAEDQELMRELGELHLQEEQRVEPPGVSAKGKAAGKKKKERKFCMLPTKVNGQRDSTWVRVYMEDVDEVGAHCGLFLPGPQYEVLVGDVGSRIVGWVHDDATKRSDPRDELAGCAGLQPRSAAQLLYYTNIYDDIMVSRTNLRDP